MKMTFESLVNGYGKVTIEHEINNDEDYDEFRRYVLYSILNFSDDELYDKLGRLCQSIAKTQIDANNKPKNAKCNNGDEPATEKQIETLRKHNITYVGGLTKYQASEMIKEAIRLENK